MANRDTGVNIGTGGNTVNQAPQNPRGGQTPGQGQERDRNLPGSGSPQRDPMRDESGREWDRSQNPNDPQRNPNRNDPTRNPQGQGGETDSEDEV